MLKKSKVVLLKAITMGALLANGGIGAEREDDKHKKGLNAPLHGAEMMPTLIAKGSEGGDIHRSLIEPHVRNILVGVDERAEMRRELLRKPIKVDLRGEPIRGVLPFQKVLNTLLVDAHKYDVPLNLTLVNATETELSELLSHPNAQFIKELDWTYEVLLINNMDAYDLVEDEGRTDETAGLTPTSDDSDEEWIDELVEFTPTSDDSDEEWIDAPIRVIRNDDFDEEWIYDLLGFMRDDLDEELINGLLAVMGNNPADIIKAEPQAPRLRRAVARARYMPPLYELIDNFGQKGVIAPPIKPVAEKSAVTNENYSSQPSGWGMTSIRNVGGNNDSNAQDLDQFKKLTDRSSSHNLVQIFCRGGERE